MFSNRNAVYLVGYTLSDEQDYDHLVALVLRHKNVIFRVIETANPPLGKPMPDRCISERNSSMDSRFRVVPGLVPDRRDTAHTLLWNKCASMSIPEMREMIALAKAIGATHFCPVGIYTSIYVNDEEIQVVQKGPDYETYKNLQLP